MPERRNPSFCLTVGDSTGIGPEIALKFLRVLASEAINTPERSWDRIIVLGDLAQLEQCSAQSALPWLEADWVTYRNVQDNGRKPPGRISYDALETAVRLIHAGEADALVTGPISKENLHAAGVNFSGHTEILEVLARRYYGVSCQSDMLFLYRNFRMLLLTRHVALNKVSQALRFETVVQSLDGLVRFLRGPAGIPAPQVCLLGVNPHAGELDGGEEATVLQPAIDRINSQYGLNWQPPQAADAVFRNFDVNHVPYEAYVAAYHDQGLIPFKMVAGYEAVNVTIGLPFLRTSVSHGTAPDIAGQGIASPASLMAAFRLALRLNVSRPSERLA